MGIECVISRHEIAQQALQEVRAVLPGYHPLEIAQQLQEVRAVLPGYHHLEIAQQLQEERAVLPVYHPLPGAHGDAAQPFTRPAQPTR